MIIEMVHHTDEAIKINFSYYLSEKLNHDYTYLANLFSEVQGTTIEKFLISHKIERVKELLVYNELNLTEIAYQMHYSSVAHLSSQFKKVTGLTLTEYIARARVEKAKALLSDPSRRISEIVFASGFGSIPRFNSVFKRHVGMPPSEYRELLRSQLAINQ